MNYSHFSPAELRELLAKYASSVNASEGKIPAKRRAIYDELDRRDIATKTDWDRSGYTEYVKRGGRLTTTIEVARQAEIKQQSQEAAKLRFGAQITETKEEETRSYSVPAITQIITSDTTPPRPRLNEKLRSSNSNPHAAARNPYGNRR